MIPSSRVRARYSPEERAPMVSEFHSSGDSTRIRAPAWNQMDDVPQLAQWPHGSGHDSGCGAGSGAAAGDWD
jgi:hypothetical protein